MIAKLALGMIYLTLITPAFAAEEVAHVYDAHGKRDPFVPLVSASGVVMSNDADLTATDMRLEGIVTDPKGDNLAIINGKMVKSNDQIGAWHVDTIGQDQVELSRDQEHFMLKLKKGGT